MCRTAIGALLLRYADEFFTVGAKQRLSFMSWHNKISECRLQISDFQCAAHLIFQSSIDSAEPFGPELAADGPVAGRNLKSAIDFTPVLGGYLNLISLLLKKVLEFEFDLTYNKTSTDWVKVSSRLATARSGK